MFHFVQYITIIRLVYTSFHISRIFFNWFYTCFWDWHSLVRVKENNERRREKGTWLLPFREQYSPKKNWCASVVRKIPPDQHDGWPLWSPLHYLARRAEKAESNLWNQSPSKSFWYGRLTALVSADLLRHSKKQKTNKQFLQLISSQHGLVSLFYTGFLKYGPFQTALCPVRSPWRHGSMDHFNWQYSS